MKRKCCICGKEFEGHGNNPYPLKSDGRCCDECNIAIVVPERVDIYLEKNKKEGKNDVKS